MTFVAANWQEMSKLARLLLLALGMWTAYGAATVLFSRNLAIFGHARGSCRHRDLWRRDHAGGADVSIWMATRPTRC